MLQPKLPHDRCLKQKSGWESRTQHARLPHGCVSRFPSPLSPSIPDVFIQCIYVCGTDVSPGLDPMQSTPVPVSYTKYVTKHMSKIEMGESICD